jgi:hypothetical protein
LLDDSIFDFLVPLPYTRICQTKDFPQQESAQGDDQDGRRILAADIVAQPARRQGSS